MVEVIEAAREAMARRDWDAMRLLLHPYLHWRDETGHVTHGRQNVLAMLSTSDAPSPPSSHEVRDGQIYRGTT
ncbi:MAG: nuclear transport factor 2 family protein [Nitriliruptorales bacterium]